MNFTQYSVGDRKRSDEGAVVSPVANTAAGAEMSALASSIGEVVETVGKAKSIYDDVQITRGEKEFERGLEEGRDLADQHGTGSIQYKEYMNKLYKSSDLSLEKKTTMYNRFKSSVFGEELAEVDYAAEQEKALEKAAFEMNFATKDSTPEELEAAKSKVVALQAASRKVSAEKEAIALEKSKASLSEARRKELEASEQKVDYDHLVNISYNFLPKITSQLAMIESSNAPIEEKVRQIDALSEQVSAVSLAQAPSLKTEQRTNVLSPLNTKISNAKARIQAGTTYSAAEVERQNKSLDAKMEMAIKIANPEAFEKITQSALLNHSAPDLLGEISQMELNSVIGAFDFNAPLPDITVSSDGNNLAADVLADAIDKVGTTTNPDGTPRTPEQDLETEQGALRFLASGAKYFDEESSPEANTKYLKLLADKADYFKSVVGKNPEVKDKLEYKLSQSFTNFIIPKVQEGLGRAIEVPESTPEERVARSGRSTFSVKKEDKKTGRRSGRSLSLAKASVDDLELQVFGGRVEFKGTNQVGRDAALKINKEAGPALNTYLRAMSAISDEKLEAVLENTKSSIWPEKYEEPTEEVAEEPAKQKEQPTLAGGGSFEEGKKYQMADGTVGIYRNGKFYAQ